MNILELEDYLVRARRNLWAMLECVPDQVLSRPLLHGEKFHGIEDLVFHTCMPYFSETGQEDRTEMTSLVPEASSTYGVVFSA